MEALTSRLAYRLVVFLVMVVPLSLTGKVGSPEVEEGGVPVLAILDADTKPEATFSMSYNGPGVVLSRSAASSEFRIVVHLVDCSFEAEDFIEVTSKNKTFKWDCPNKLTRGEDGRVARTDALQVLDDFEEVRVVPRFGGLKLIGSKGVKAHIVANLYRDIGSSDQDTSCPNGLFNCNAYLYINCGHTCCANQLKYDAFTPVGNARCIPDSLKCNGNPSCGRYSADEIRDLCSPLDFCTCGDISGDSYCGVFSMSSILIMAITPLFIVPLSIGFYVRIRATSVSLITLLDMLTTGVLAVIHLAFAFLYYDVVNANALAVQIGELLSGGLCCVHFLLALWVFAKMKKVNDPNIALLFTKRYLVVNLVLLVIYQVGAFLYFVITFQRFILQDMRLWTAILGLATRLVYLFSVHHYLCQLCWQYRRTSGEANGMQS